MRKFLTLLLALFLFLPAATPGDVSTESPAGHIDISGKIDESTLSSVNEAIDVAKKAGSTRLDISINSPGGSVTDGLMVIQAIRDSRIPTTCRVSVMAASMAAVILESPACNERVVSPSAVLMLHSVGGPAQGNEREVTNNLGQIHALNLAVAHLIAARIGLTVDEYMQHISAESQELWFVGADAVSTHMADAVSSSD